MFKEELKRGDDVQAECSWETFSTGKAGCVCLVLAFLHVTDVTPDLFFFYNNFVRKNSNWRA